MFQRSFGGNGLRRAIRSEARAPDIRGSVLTERKPASSAIFTGFSAGAAVCPETGGPVHAGRERTGGDGESLRVTVAALGSRRDLTT